MGNGAVDDKVNEELNYVIRDQMAHLIYMKEIEEGPPLREMFAGCENPRDVRAYWLIRGMLQGFVTAEDFRAEGIPDPTPSGPSYHHQSVYTTKSR